MMKLIRSYLDFIERHWGDYVGLLLILLGIALIGSGAAVELQTGKELHIIYAQGGALITTGVGLLKLRVNPKAEGRTETETTTQTTSVTDANGGTNAKP